MTEYSFYGVLTTGIFCRFGCPSRQPKAENVIYLKDLKAAEVADLRPCKRCRPDLLETPTAAFYEQLVEQFFHTAKSNPEFTIEQCAKHMAISKKQLERICKRVTGLSPRTLLSEGYTI